jgi:hypothetical protein
MFNHQPEYYTTQLASLPIRLLCHKSGLIAFIRSNENTKFTYIEHLSGDLTIVITEDNVNFRNKDVAYSFTIEYNELVAWRDNKELLKWLQEFNLVSPV